MARFIRSVAGGLIGVGWLGALAACRHAGPAPQREGQSSFQMIPPSAPPGAGRANGAMSEAASRDVWVEAMPILPLATPVYPRAARAAKLGVVTVAVHLTVDTAGRVSSVAPSLAGFAIANRFSGEFQAAVEAAVAQWRFTPAEIRHMETAAGEDGGSYLRLAAREKIEAACDVQFTFSETGEVWAGAAGTGR